MFSSTISQSENWRSNRGVGRIYDTAYIALDREMGTTMVTADRILYDKTSGLGFVELLA
jgi:predicted nucleic acid-binding protein